VTHTEGSVTAALAAMFPGCWDHITATLTRLTGDRGLAEECTQDAFARALARWPADGVPDKPLAWLVTTARNRAFDRARRAVVEAEKLRLLARESAGVPAEPAERVIPDDQLEMMFACAHPVLTTDAQAALILSALTSLSTTEMADAFLVSERAMRQRVFRAKQRLWQVGASLKPPPVSELAGRLPAILHVVHVLFNAGYEGIGDSGPVRQGLMEDALGLGRLLAFLVPGEPETLGLLALMLLHHARRDAHAWTVHAENGGSPPVFIPLAEQDRSRWDRAEVAEGLNLAVLAVSAGRPGPFQVQAVIAALHDMAPTAAATDWRMIARWYAELARLTPRPIVMPSQSLPTAIADSPEAGLLSIVESVARYPGSIHELLPTARAGLLRRTRRLTDAADAYREALAEAASIALARADIPLSSHVPCLRGFT
jgi:RNA polymerase sigma-70 factor, ECF subfamily